MLKTNTSRAAAFGTLIFLGSATLLNAEGYVEVCGTIESLTFDSTETNRPGSVITNKPILFKCVVGTNEWRIDNNFARGAEVAWYFDGTNVFESILPTNAPSSELLSSVKNRGLAPVPFEQARSNVTVRVSATLKGHPFGNMGVNLPWLAFCSGSYLKQPDRVIPVPVASLRHTPDGMGYSDEVQTFGDELGLPKSVKLFTSKLRYEKSVNDHLFRQFREAPQKRDSGFMDGIQKFGYQVIESTNRSGWNLPVRFEFFQTEPDANGKWFIRYRGVGTITSITDASPARNLFRQDIRQTIVDARFRDPQRLVNSVVYQTTNDALKETNSTELQRIYAAASKRAGSLGTENKSGVSMRFVLLLCIVIIVPFVLFVLRKNLAKN